MEDIDKIIKFLNYIKLDSISHSNRSLISHLIGTYSIIKHWQLQPSVCLAGLCHSIYGTTSLDSTGDSVSLSPRRRSFLRDLIGEEAEKIVFTYCSLPQGAIQRVDQHKGPYFYLVNRWSEQLIEVDNNFFSSLATLDLANRIDFLTHAGEDLDKKNFFMQDINYLIAVKNILPRQVKDFAIKFFGLSSSLE